MIIFLVIIIVLYAEHRFHCAGFDQFICPALKLLFDEQWHNRLHYRFNRIKVKFNNNKQIRVRFKLLLFIESIYFFVCFVYWIQLNVTMKTYHYKCIDNDGNHISLVSIENYAWFVPVFSWQSMTKTYATHAFVEWNKLEILEE